MPLPLALISTDGLSPAGYPVLQLQQATESETAVYLKEPDGTAYVAASGNDVKLTTCETLSGYGVDMEIDCEWTDISTGLISVPIAADEAQTPGIWIRGVYSLRGQHARQGSAPLPLLRGDPSVFGGFDSVAKERSHHDCRDSHGDEDRCAEDNFLLDSLEFSDSEIAFCIRRPVDWWNEAAQRVGVATYTYTTFPFRYHWTDATVGELLKIASLNLNRNRITLNAGGINTDDKERGKLYLELGDKMIKEYRNWSIGQIKSMNLQSWRGFVKSGWF